MQVRIESGEPPVAGELAPASVDVLIVDGDGSRLHALATALAVTGANLVFARSGREALVRLGAGDFALVVLDGDEGFETGTRIRAREPARLTPIVFVTSLAPTDEAVRAACALGAVDFLFAPLTADVLRAKVSFYVELHRKTEEVRRQRAVVRANVRLRLLAETAGDLLDGLDPEALLPGVFRRLREGLHLDAYLHYLLDGDALRLHAWGGISDAQAARHALVPLGGHDYVASREPTARHPRRLNEMLDGNAAILRDVGCATAVVFPLVVGEHVLGTLAFARRARGGLDAEDRATLQAVADHVALAIDRARLVDELRRRNEALALADRRKDEFLALLAHELRNPLASVVNALELERRPGLDGAHRARARGAIERQVGHLVRLVDDLLDVARIRSGRIELRRSPVTLGALVDHAMQLTQPALEARGHRCDVEVADPSLRLDADGTRLVQVIANLLANAARYTDRAGHIELAAFADGDEAVIRVRDNGRGIPREMLDSIFELFVQVQQGRDPLLGGLGLGLTLVRRLVGLHGGRVTAHSDGPGHGSEFVVRLPVTGEPPPGGALAAGGDPEPPAHGAPLRVLLVEDNEDVRETMRVVLELVGHEVLVAADGVRGAELVLAAEPDVALVDLGLPGLDGCEVARRVRPSTRARLIALTGFGRDEDRRRTRAAGFDDHLVKPVEPGVLVRAIGRVLASPRAGR